MAEVNSLNVVEALAGRKMSAVANKLSCKIMRMPATFAQLAIDDTVKTGIVLPAGSRVLDVQVRHGTGTASSTINIGLRLAASPFTVVDATALGSLHAITTATGGVKVITGTILAAGVDHQIANDSEVYITAKGAVFAANQAFELAVTYLAP